MHVLLNKILVVVMIRLFVKTDSRKEHLQDGAKDIRTRADIYTWGKGVRFEGQNENVANKLMTKAIEACENRDVRIVM